MAENNSLLTKEEFEKLFARYDNSPGYLAYSKEKNDEIKLEIKALIVAREQAYGSTIATDFLDTPELQKVFDDLKADPENNIPEFNERGPLTKARQIEKDWKNGSDLAVSEIDSPELFQEIVENMFEDSHVVQYRMSKIDKLTEEFKEKRPDVYKFVEAERNVGLIKTILQRSDVPKVLGPGASGNDILDPEEISSLAEESEISGYIDGVWKHSLPEDLTKAFGEVLKEIGGKDQAIYVKKAISNLEAQLFDEEGFSKEELKNSLLAASGTYGGPYPIGKNDPSVPGKQEVDAIAQALVKKFVPKPDGGGYPYGIVLDSKAIEGLLKSPDAFSGLPEEMVKSMKDALTEIKDQGKELSLGSAVNNLDAQLYDGEGLTPVELANSLRDAGREPVSDDGPPYR